jgi:outer membrane receptor protein involved in Fe transport
MRRDVAPLRAQVIIGADLDYSPGSFTAVQALLARNAAANGAAISYPGYTRGATQYDYDVTYRSVSPYAQTQWTLTPRLRVDAGARVDLAGYDYATHLAPLDTGAHRVPASTSVSYAHVSPKLGVTYDLSPSLNLYASYRHGFRAPAQSQLFQQNSAANTVGLRPVRANSMEAGVRGSVGSRVAYELDTYDMIIRNDIVTYVTPQNTREATNAGETRHRGIESSVGVQIVPSLRVDASYSVSSQRYVSWSPSATTSYAGKLIEGAPRDLGTLLVTYAPPVLRGGRASAEVVHVGRYAMNPANTHYYAGYRTANLMLDYPAFHNGSVFMRVSNLTNRNFAEIVTYDAFQKEQFSPGNPRTVHVGARMSWTR